MKRRIRIVSCMIVILLCLCMGIAPIQQKVIAETKTSLSDGTYTVKSFLRSATSEQASMGNAAIEQPTQVIVKNGALSLRMECKAITTNLGTKKFIGYLARMNYYPGWKGGNSGIELPKDEVAEAVKIESYYNGVYDSYNDPKKGTDQSMKGKQYPHYLNLSISENEKEIWVQVYVPVMESVSKGSGLQYARLQISWDTLKKISDKVPDSFQSDEKESVDKGGLQYLLLSANTLLSHKELYTKVTIEKLRLALKNAQTVYVDENATKEQVREQMKALSSAITSLKEQKKSSNTEINKEKEQNVKELKDGIYSVSGQMLKTDKKTKSMSNQAVNHKIQLTVKKGIYYLSLNFQGMKIHSQFGYLSKMKYYVSGYKTNSYGVPSGNLKSVTVHSYQKDAKGKKVKDAFGTNYPNKVTFPLIKEALNDGYVPLQVFVPIMESISPGSGNQSVFLKLDLSSVKSEKNASAFRNNKNSDFSTSSMKNGKTAKFPTSDLSQTEEIKSTTLPRNSSGNSKSTTDQTIDGTAQIQTPISNMNTNAKTTTGDLSTAANIDTQEEDSPVVVPSVMSILVSVAGFLYKVKSRG